MTETTPPLSIKLENWPAADRQALERALTPDDAGTGECGWATHLSAATLGNYIFSYGQWLEFLTRTGNLDESEGLIERTTPQRVDAWRRQNLSDDYAPNSRRQMLANLCPFLRRLAPNQDWTFIIRPGGKSLKKAIRSKPKPFVVRDVADVLVHVRELHQEGLSAPDGPEKRRALRDAALLGLLLTRAPRVGSLAAMTLDRHVVVRGDGIWHLWFPGEHVKNGGVLNFPLDAEQSVRMTDYHLHAREGFPGAEDSNQLWMGMKGPMTIEGPKQITKRRTKEWFGKAYGPQIFRKWLRASAARRDPTLAMDAADIMGHTPEVSAQHYAEASGLHSSLRHGDRVAERRARYADLARAAYAKEPECKKKE